MLDETAAARPDEPSRSAYEPPKVTPLAQNAPFFTIIRTAVQNPYASIPAECYSEPYSARSWGGRVTAHICDPEILEEILVRRWRDFPKSEIDDRVFSPVLGEGLLTAEGEDWRWKRRLAAPAFAPGALAPMAPLMAAPFDAAAEAWVADADRARDGAAEIDVSAAMIQATLAVIARILFADPKSVDSQKIARAIEAYLEPTPWVVVGALLGLPRWTPYPGKARQRRARETVRGVVRDAILARRRMIAGGAAPPEDLTAALMAARDPETDRPLSDEDMVDMLLTLVAAGHETTAHSLTWALYCLAHQPRLQDELAEEARAAAGGGPLEAAQLPELARIEAALKETLRLFPVAPIIGRKNAKAEEFGALAVPANSLIAAPIYAMHRNTLYWERPDVFDITRFLGRPDPPRTLYMPFGAGPRICIGQRLSMMESAFGLAALLRRARFEPCEATECDPVHRVTLRPRRGLLLRARPRA